MFEAFILLCACAGFLRLDYIDFITQLTVADTNYDTIVAAITKMRKDIEIVQLIRISK